MSDILTRLIVLAETVNEIIDVRTANGVRDSNIQLRSRLWMSSAMHVRVFNAAAGGGGRWTACAMISALERIYTSQLVA